MIGENRFFVSHKKEMSISIFEAAEFRHSIIEKLFMLQLFTFFFQQKENDYCFLPINEVLNQYQ